MAVSDEGSGEGEHGCDDGRLDDREDWMPYVPRPSARAGDAEALERFGHILPWADDDVGAPFGDWGYFEHLQELLGGEACPYDEPLEGGQDPLPWTPEFAESQRPVRLRKGWRGRVRADEQVEAAAPPLDVFGPGLSRHTWLWRTAEAELASAAEEPKRIGAWAPLLVAQAAEEMLATGPTALPGLVRAAVGFRIGDAGAVRDYVAGELERYLSGPGESDDGTASGSADDETDPVARLLARAMVRADSDTLARDLESCAAELLFRNGEAPAELANRVAECLASLADTPSEATAPALEAAERLVKDGLVPVGDRPAGRAIAAAAGWLSLGAALDCAPAAVAMLLSVPSASRTLARAQTRGFGPFGRYVGADGDEVVAPWRSGGTLLVGLPGTGKTQLLIWLAACAPGAVVAATPNLLDVYDFAARATDHDCLVFDPGGLIGDTAPPGIKVVCLDVLSLLPDSGANNESATATWDSAGTVAAQMVAASSNNLASQYGAFWSATSAELLRIYLFAAKMSGKGLSAVRAWLQHDEENELEGILARAGVAEATDSFCAHIRQDYGNLRASIVESARADLRAFANLSDVGEHFDFDRFVAGRGTLVLLTDPTNSAACEGAVAFMTAQIVEAVYRRFRRGEAGAPVACLIDEAPRNPGLAPILAHVLAEGPKCGLNPVAACQTPEQFNSRHGGSKEITEAAARTVVFPGSMPSDLLQVAPFIHHEAGDGTDVTDFDPARLARPDDGTMHVLEATSLRRMRSYAAHSQGLWRLCTLDAAFARAGATAIAYW